MEHLLYPLTDAIQCNGSMARSISLLRHRPDCLLMRLEPLKGPVVQFLITDRMSQAGFPSQLREIAKAWSKY